MARFRSDPRWSCAAVLLLAVACWNPPAVAGSSLRTASLETETGTTVLVLGLSSSVRPRVFTLNDPRRVVIDLPDTQRGIALSLPTGAGTVKSLRGSARNGSSFRLVLEVTDEAPAAPQVVRNEVRLDGDAFFDRGLFFYTFVRDPRDSVSSVLVSTDRIRALPFARRAMRVPLRFLRGSDRIATDP